MTIERKFVDVVGCYHWGVLGVITIDVGLVTSVLMH